MALMDSPGVTYAEVRSWIVWLRIFTISEIADSMGVNWEVAERFVWAAKWHGIIRDTDDYVMGPEGEEEIWEWIPLPPGPRFHPTKTPPEVLIGYTDIINRRGITQRLMGREDRKLMSSSPGARRKLKERDRAYDRMMEALRKRAEKNKMKERIRHERGGARKPGTIKAGKNKGKQKEWWTLEDEVQENGNGNR